MEILTQRLQMHPMRPEEWRDILSIFEDFSASPAAAYDYPLPTSEEKVRQQVRIWSESGFFYSVCLRDHSRVIGYLCFPAEENCEDERELGYLFHRQWHGKGYAQEAAAAMILQLQRQYGISRFTARLALENEASRRLAERLGFVQVGEESRVFHKNPDGSGKVERCGIFERKV